MKKYAILALTAVMATSILTVPAKALPTQPQSIVEGGCVLPVPDLPSVDTNNISNDGIQGIVDGGCILIPHSKRCEMKKDGFSRTCRPGDRSEDVKHLHEHLRTRGYSDLDEDGYFGPKTEKAVRDLQGKLGLKVDGIVTPEVWKVI